MSRNNQDQEQNTNVKFFGIDYRVFFGLIGLIPIILSTFAILVWFNTKDLRAQMTKVEVFQESTNRCLEKKAEKLEVDLQFANVQTMLKNFETSYQRQIDDIKQSNENLSKNIQDLNSNLTKILIHINRNSRGVQ